MKNQQLLVVSSNAPHDAEVVVSVELPDGTLPPVAVESAEVRDGKVVITIRPNVDDPTPLTPRQSDQDKAPSGENMDFEATGT